MLEAATRLWLPLQALSRAALLPVEMVMEFLGWRRIVQGWLCSGEQKDVSLASTAPVPEEDSDWEPLV